MSDQESSGSSPEEGARALFVDLDYVVHDGYTKVYDGAASVLKQKDITLTPGLFGADFLSRSLTSGVARLLSTTGRDRLSADKLAADLRAAALKALTDGDMPVVPGVAKAIDHVKKGGLLVGVVTRLDADASTALLDKLGLGDSVDVVDALDTTPFTHPTSDCWLRLARSAGVLPRACVAVAASGRAARTALFASMSCVALPSSVTAFEDFGGTDAVIDDAGQLKGAIDAVLERTQ